MREEKTLSNKERFAILRRTLRLLNKADKGHILRRFLEILPSVISEIAGIYLAALVVDGISGGKKLRELFLTAALVCGADLLCSLGAVCITRRKNCHDFAKRNNLLRFLWEKLMDMDYVHLEKSETHVQYERAREYLFDHNTGFDAVVNNLVYAFRGLCGIGLGLLLAAPMAFRPPVAKHGFAYFVQSPWGLASVLFCVAALEVFRSIYFNPKVCMLIEKTLYTPGQLQNLRLGDFYFSFAVYNYRNGKEIRLYQEDELILNEKEKCDRFNIQKWRTVFRKNAKYELVMHLLEICSSLLLYSFAGFRAITGQLTPGEVVAFVLLFFTQIQTGISRVSDGLNMVKMAPPFLKNIFDFLDRPEAKYKGSLPTEKRDDNEYEFEFRHVWFRYPGSEAFVLKDVSLKWRIGEKMALVGKNGCGKSTLVKLLCRLYDPTEGVITLNGIDIRKYKYEDYIALFSVVFQDSQLFSFSVAENVAASLDYDADRVEDCVRRAGLSERLDRMEQGIETCLYKDFDEKGVEISGGEAQKLMLARAIYKGAPFIVLDEPTAALDPISEHEIYTKFNEIVGTRTAIYISHRLSSCRFCDEITVMEEGRIVERGSHEALLETGSVYPALWNAQAEYYRETAGELFV